MERGYFNDKCLQKIEFENFHMRACFVNGKEVLNLDKYQE